MGNFLLVKQTLWPLRTESKHIIWTELPHWMDLHTTFSKRTETFVIIFTDYFTVLVLTLCSIFTESYLELENLSVVHWSLPFSLKNLHGIRAYSSSSRSCLKSHSSPLLQAPLMKKCLQISALLLSWMNGQLSLLHSAI